MYEALLKQTPEYQKIAAALASPGPAALFGLPPAGRALVYGLLARDLGRPLCIVTPGEAEATHFADDLKALGVAADVFPPAGLHAPPGGGRRPGIRIPPAVGAGRPGRGTAGRRLRPGGGPAAIHRPPGRVHGQHPHPQAGDAVLPGRAGAASVRRGLCPPLPGGGPGPVQRPGRHRGHLPSGYAVSGPAGVLGR